MGTYPITREQAKDWARELDDSEDVIFDSLIATACLAIGEMAGRSLVIGEGAPAVQADGDVPEHDVPENLRHAVLLLVSHWFHNREAATEKQMREVPIGIQSLVGLSKIGWVGA